MLFGWYPLNWQMKSFSHLHIFKQLGKHNRHFGRLVWTLITVLSSPSQEVLPSLPRRKRWWSHQFPGTLQHVFSFENQDNAAPLEVWSLPGRPLGIMPLLPISCIAKSYASSGSFQDQVHSFTRKGFNYCQSLLFSVLYIYLNYIFIFATPVLCSLQYIKNTQMLWKE